MLFLITSKPTEQMIESALEDLDGYMKFDVDIERKIATIGGLRHFEGEELLLEDGSKQDDLWGGGIDWETKQIDYESMINIRPRLGNMGNEVMDENIRNKMKEIICKLLEIDVR